jgi:hypothetical protein
MVQHFVVYDALDDVVRHVTFIQSGVNADSFSYVRIAGELDGVLMPDPSVGAPGYLAVYFV